MVSVYRGLMTRETFKTTSRLSVYNMGQTLHYSPRQHCSWRTKRVEAGRFERAGFEMPVEIQVEMSLGIQGPGV